MGVNCYVFSRGSAWHMLLHNFMIKLCNINFNFYGRTANISVEAIKAGGMKASSGFTG